MIIKHNFETIIRNWWLNNLGMTCYPCIKINFDMIIDFWMPCLKTIRSTGYYQFSWLCVLILQLQHDVLLFFLTPNMFVKRLSDFLALVFDCCLGHRKTGTFLCDFLLGINHSSINNILYFLLVITLTCMLIYIFYVIQTLVFKRRPVE